MYTYMYYMYIICMYRKCKIFRPVKFLSFFTGNEKFYCSNISTLTVYTCTCKQCNIIVKQQDYSVHMYMYNVVKP